MKIRWGIKRALRSAAGGPATSAAGSAAQIRSVIAEVIKRRDAGEEIDDGSIERSHPDLNPQLGEQLRLLRGIQAAGRQGREEPSSGGSDGLENLLDLDLSMLNEALDDYELLSGIEYGGQGAVYRAVQRSTGRTVAVKVLLDGPLASKRHLQRFNREIEILSQLQHPNIVTLFHGGVVRGRPYFAMELVEGLPIDDYVCLNEPTVAETARLFIRVCRGVQAAHHCGIIHRDLKPANILVDEAGEPHILDFGLAKGLDSSNGKDDTSSVSFTGQVVGTLPYLSPEQAQGFGGELDVRSDIYSLGVILYHLLSGEFPYGVDGPVRWVREQIIRSEPTSLRRVSPHDGDSLGKASEDLDAIVLKALEKEPAQRYQSAAAFADDLECYLSGEPVAARADRRLYLLKKAARKYRLHTMIATAFAILLAAGLIGTTMMWRRADQIARIAQTGLLMGGHVREGSSLRDQRRLDEAEASFKGAIEVGRSAPTFDQNIRRFLYDAHHRLAELYYGTNRPELADPECDAAVQIAQDLAAHEPENRKWRRLLGFSHILRGRMAVARKDWTPAFDSFTKAERIQEELVQVRPDNHSFKTELAVTHRWLGRCSRMLGQSSDSLKHYMASYRIVNELVTSYPDVVDYVIDLTMTETKIGVWHMSQESPDHDRDALRWFQAAEHRIAGLRDSKQAENRRWDLDQISDAIDANRKIIRARQGSNSP